MSKQDGFLLPQLVIVVILVTLISAYFGKLYMDRSREHAQDGLARLVGARLDLLDSAAETYAMKYSSEIQLQKEINSDDKTFRIRPESVRNPTPADFRGLGILRADVVMPVLYGDKKVNFNVQFTVPGSGVSCTVPSCDVAYLVSTTEPLLNKNGQVDVRRLTVATSMANPARAGVSLPASVGGDPTQFVGKDGVVIADNENKNPGLLAIIGGIDNQEFDAFLRRDGSLAMTGNLDMGQKDINNGGAANFNDDIRTAKNVNAEGNVNAKEEVSGSLLRATAAGVIAESGNIVAESGDIVAHNNLQGSALTLTMPVGKGTLCNEPNQVAVSGNATVPELLICQQGVWSSVGAKLLSYTRKFEGRIKGGVNRPTVNVWCDPGDVVTSGSISGSAVSGLRAVPELSEFVEDLVENKQGWAGRFAYNAMNVDALIIARCLTFK